MKNIKLFPIILISAVFMASCATIINGTKQDLLINSEPEGAEVYINGKYYGTTPCMTSVRRKQKKSEYNERNELHYVLKKEGYEDREIFDQRKIHWTTYIDGFLNVPVGSVVVASCIGDPEVAGVGLAMGLPFIASLPIDLVTGSLNKYNSDITTSLRVDAYKKTGNVSSGENKGYVFQKKSDVDINIPRNAEVNSMRFALIIGNEDYSSFQTDLVSENNVDYARNDASAFKEYAQNILGIPEKNIIFLLDGTSGQMNRAISKLKLIIKSTAGDADVFVYYAGHGLPDEVTKEPFLMPVDISGKNAQDGISLSGLYSSLSEYPSKKITVFIDACFSGGARNQGLFAARGVKVKPKEAPLSGKIVAFTASSEEESSLPYKNEEHGLFTYYLLKKLQETKGDVSYIELSDYLRENVPVNSLIVNDKEQYPQTNVSSSIVDEWKEWKIK